MPDEAMTTEAAERPTMTAEEAFEALFAAVNRHEQGFLQMQKVVNDICDYRKQDQDALNRYDRRLARVQKRVRKGFTKSMEADLQRLDKMREEASRRAWKMNLVYVAIPSWMAMATAVMGFILRGCGCDAIDH